MATKNLWKKIFIWVVVISLLWASVWPIVYSILWSDNNIEIDYDAYIEEVNSNNENSDNELESAVIEVKSEDSDSSDTNTDS